VAQGARLLRVRGEDITGELVALAVAPTFPLEAPEAQEEAMSTTAMEEEAEAGREDYSSLSVEERSPTPRQFRLPGEQAEPQEAMVGLAEAQVPMELSVFQ